MFWFLIVCSIIVEEFVGWKTYILFLHCSKFLSENPSQVVCVEKHLKKKTRAENNRGWNQGPQG